MTICCSRSWTKMEGIIKWRKYKSFIWIKLNLIIEILFDKKHHGLVQLSGKVLAVFDQKSILKRKGIGCFWTVDTYQLFFGRKDNRQVWLATCQPPFSQYSTADFAAPSHNWLSIAAPTSRSLMEKKGMKRKEKWKWDWILSCVNHISIFHFNIFPIYY